jgi:hypothetical protein
LLTNIRQEWKFLPGTKTLAYFAAALLKKKKDFTTLTAGVLCLKLFSSWLLLPQN